MILAAGFGTRLKPLTDTIPKPLIPVNGVPLIVYNLALLKKFGFSEVVINLHYLGDKIEQALGDGSRLGFKISYSREREILGTAGGLKHGEKLLKNGPFLILNSDIIIDIDLKKMIDFHNQQKAIATLGVLESPLAKQLGPVEVENDTVVSMLGQPKVHPASKSCLFMGIHILESRFFDLFKKEGKTCIVRDFYIPQLTEGNKLGAFVHTGYWNDLGTIESLQTTEKELVSKKLRLSFEEELKILANQL